MKYNEFAAIFILSMSLIGCATPTTRTTDISEQAVDAEASKQLEIRLATDLRDHDRVMAVSYPLLKSSVPLCGDDLVTSLGFTPFNLHTLSEDVRPAAARLYDMDDSLQVMTVPPGSPADTAGLKRGDKLFAIGGQAAPSGDKAYEKWQRLVSSLLKDRDSIILTIIRDGEQSDTLIHAEETCDYSIAETYGDTVNAYADGKNIVLSAGMLRFTENDNELALVIAHEIAHNALNHMDAKKANYGTGSILDIAAALAGVNTGGAFGSIAARSHSKGFEAEADYVGLYIMALANISIDDAPDFWRRMAATHPESTRNGGFLSTHPTTAERFVALDSTIQEINEKQENGIALMPNKKGDSY